MNKNVMKSIHVPSSLLERLGSKTILQIKSINALETLKNISEPQPNPKGDKSWFKNI